MSTIHFVGGEKGGVGKSVVARLLAQYCIDRGTSFVGVDADSSHGTLARHYREYARPVDLTSSQSVDEIITLATEGDRRVIVDLPAQSERLLSAWIAEAGILDLARECDVRIVFWHVMDDGKDSLQTLDRLLARHGAAASYCIVRNRGRGKDFSLFETSPTRLAAEALMAQVIDLSELNGAVMQKIDRIDASFWAAINNPEVGGETLSRLDRQRVKVWLLTAFDQISRLQDLF